jgi:hypothetical protein
MGAVIGQWHEIRCSALGIGGTSGRDRRRSSRRERVRRTRGTARGMNRLATVTEKERVTDVDEGLAPTAHDGHQPVRALGPSAGDGVVARGPHD